MIHMVENPAITSANRATFGHNFESDCSSVFVTDGCGARLRWHPFPRSAGLTGRVRHDGTENQKRRRRLACRRGWLCIGIAICSNSNCADRENPSLIRQRHGWPDSLRTSDRCEWYALRYNILWRHQWRRHRVFVRSSDPCRDDTLFFLRSAILRGRREPQRQFDRCKWYAVWHHL